MCASGFWNKNVLSHSSFDELFSIFCTYSTLVIDVKWQRIFHRKMNVCRRLIVDIVIMIDNKCKYTAKEKERARDYKKKGENSQSQMVFFSVRESNFVWCVILVVCTFVRSVKCRNGRNQHRIQTNSCLFYWHRLFVQGSRLHSLAPFLTTNFRNEWHFTWFLFTFVKGILSKN